jgi:chemotaxis protein MotB
MRRKRREEEQENHERWLLTYADLITLLLAFFIMMYTLSKQDAVKYQEVTSYLRAIFTGGTAILNKGGAADAATEAMPSAEELNRQIMKQLEEEIKSMMPADGKDHNITVFVDERGIVVRVLDKAFFDEGKADLKERAKAAIKKIIPIIDQVNRPVRIEGHTDNVPISTNEFKSNWELSVRRATEVVRYIIDFGELGPEKISAAGYAEYKPLMPNSTPENRALNRRIEIIIDKTNGKIQTGLPAGNPPVPAKVNLPVPGAVNPPVPEKVNSPVPAKVNPSVPAPGGRPG